MAEALAEYRQLAKDVRREAARHLITTGQLAPLPVFWLVGLGLVLFLLPLGFLAVWTVVIFLAGFGMARGYLVSAEAYKVALRTVAERRFPAGSFTSLEARDAFVDVATQFEAVASRLDAVERKLGPQALLRRALNNLYAMLVTYYHAAHRAVSYGEPERLLEKDVRRDLGATLTLLEAFLEMPAGERAALATQLARDTEATLDSMQEKLAAIDVDPAKAELEYLKKELREGFTRLKQTQGVKALDQLTSRYDLVQPMLAQHQDTDPLVLAPAPGLVEGVFRRGLALLHDALTRAQAIVDSAVESWQRELEELEKEIPTLKQSSPHLGERENEIAALKQGSPDPDELPQKESRRSDLMKKLGKVRAHESALRRLFHQCQECETALDLTRLDLADFHARRSEQNAQTIIERLRSAIAQAQEVQDEMRRMGL